MADIVSSIISVVESTSKVLGIELVDVQYQASRYNATVQIFVEKEGGIGIDDCSRLSRMVEHDLEDIIPGKYQLEVSSPGLNRPIKKEDDYLRHQGKLAAIVTLLPLDDRKNFEGRLGGIEDGHVIIKMPEGEVRIPFNGIKKAHLVPEINFNP
ncbi:MAG: ribosome maturation factor RimP [Candidatus Desantisbacteria bacterium]